MEKILIGALFVVAAFGAQVANATIITFDSLEVAGPGSTRMLNYSEGGYTFTTSYTGNSNLVSAHQGFTNFYLGSASMSNNLLNTDLILTQNGGGTFSLSSMDLAPLSNYYQRGGDVSFVGYLHGGSTVVNTFTMGLTFSFQKVSFVGFNNLDSVTWQQNMLNLTQFDNVNVSVTAVPEPETYAMMMAGLGLLGFIARRKRKDYERV